MTQPAVPSRAGLDKLIGMLINEGYRVVGPTKRDDAIVLAELESGHRTVTVFAPPSRSRSGTRPHHPAL